MNKEKIKNNTRLIIIDHCLMSPIGHNWHYTYSIAQQAIKEKINVMVVSNVNLTHTPPIKTKPWFSVAWDNTPSHCTTCKKIAIFFIGFSSTYKIFKICKYCETQIKHLFKKTKYLKKFSQNINPKFYIHRCINYINRYPTLKKYIKLILSPILWVFFLVNKKSPILNSRFANELYSLIKKNNITNDDHIFIPNISYEQLIEFWYLLATSNLKKPYWHIMLRSDLNEIPEQDKTMFLMAFKSFSKENFFNEKIQFYVDTLELKTQYQIYSHIEPTILPIPHCHLITTQKKTNHRTLIIGYFGDIARWKDKGLHYLPSIVSSINKKGFKVKFLIQGISNNLTQDKELQDICYQLTKFPNVQALPAILSEKEYNIYFTKSNIILLPYVKGYEKKSSGILAEAIASGKPVVIPQNTSLATMAGVKSGSVTFQCANDIPSALEKAINNYSLLEKKAHVYAHTFRKFHSPSNLINILFSTSFSLPIFKKKIIILIDKGYMLDDSMAGNRHTLKEQLYTFKSLGLETLLWITWNANKDITIKNIVNIMTLSPHKIDFLHYKSHIKYLINAKNNLLDGINTLESAIKAQIPYDLNKNMKKIIRKKSTIAVIGHYIFTQPIIKKILSINSATHCICETHDRQTLQYTIRNNIPYDEKIFTYECSVLNTFDTVIAVAQDEYEAFAKYLPKKTQLILPPMPIHTYQSQELNIDLLFVGSSHTFNKEGLEWFLNSVQPLLQKKYTLHIVGSSCNVLPISIEKNPLVKRHGIVNDIKYFYKKAKIVIVPILTGTGISIKTLESFSYGKATVSTKIGLRGIHNPPIIPCDTADNFAKQILYLLNFSHAREKLEKKTLQWALQNISIAIYREKWKNILYIDS